MKTCLFFCFTFGFIGASYGVDYIEQLFHAAEKGCNSWIEKLISQKLVNINVRGQGGLTALHVASACGQTKTVEFLLTSGAAKDAETVEGITYLNVTLSGFRKFYPVKKK